MAAGGAINIRANVGTFFFTNTRPIAGGLDLRSYFATKYNGTTTKDIRGITVNRRLFRWVFGNGFFATVHVPNITIVAVRTTRRTTLRGNSGTGA